MELDDIERGTRVARDLQFSEPVTCREVKRVLCDIDTEETVYFTVHECADGCGEILTADEMRDQFIIVEGKSAKGGSNDNSQ